MAYEELGKRAAVAVAAVQADSQHGSNIVLACCSHDINIMSK